MKKLDLFKVFLTAMLLVFVTGCGANSQITKVSDKKYSVYVGGYTSMDRDARMKEWQEAAKKACNGGEYTIVSGPTTGKQGTIGITVEGIVECK